MKKFTIGLDYGSLSGRGVLVDTADGSVVAEAAMNYPHGAMDERLPDGTVLPTGWTVQHPEDFRRVLQYVVPELLKNSGAAAEQIVGVGVDFTSATVIPLDENFRPLCDDPALAGNPHAWPKMWKHNAAQPQAQKMDGVAKAQGRPYLARHGGSIPYQSLLPKVVQMCQEAPELFEKTACFMEAGDYLTSLLIGGPTTSCSMAAARALWSEEEGYPDNDFFCAVDARLRDLPRRKLAAKFPDCTFGYPGEKIGTLCPEMAEKLGLCPGIAVTAAQMDGYAAMPGISIVDPGVVMLVMGTSTATMLLGEEKKSVEGITACVPNTYYPGYIGYASGQSSVGDCFQWVVNNCVPESYAIAAREQGVSLHQYLTGLSAHLKPGETGLVALDWLNGNKSCLANSNLTGLVLGMTLKTKPEHIYRAFQEATAFGCRVILEAYEQAGVPVREIVACGGIAGKNPVLMQIYADVLGKPLWVSRCTQAPALGTAIYAAAAAGEYPDIFAAVRAMGDKERIHYTPDPENHRAYEALYRKYVQLHDWFGREHRALMEDLTAGRTV